eukprot:3332789-Amphidinium_carterae.1
MTLLYTSHKRQILTISAYERLQKVKNLTVGGTCSANKNMVNRASMVICTAHNPALFRWYPHPSWLPHQKLGANPRAVVSLSHPRTAKEECQGGASPMASRTRRDMQGFRTRPKGFRGELPLLLKQ